MYVCVMFIGVVLWVDFGCVSMVDYVCVLGRFNLFLDWGNGVVWFFGDDDLMYF